MALQAQIPSNDSAAISPARLARVAVVAASIASVGDLLLLYVANAQRSELGLPRAGPAWLWIGGTLGVIAIPFYAQGYRSAARLVAPVAGRAARALVVAGACGALLGAVIHGLTAAHIGSQLDGTVPGSDPLASLGSSGPLLLSLWGLAALGVAVASALFAWLVVHPGSAVPRWMALANPALLTIALGAVALPFGLLRAFLTPAAPNLAHLVFFALCWRILRWRGSLGGAPPA